MVHWDSLDLGESPYNEDCAQLGSEDYARRAKAEIRAYRQALINMHGEPPDGVELVIKSNPHDFGTYYSLVAYYDPDVEGALQYALLLEGHGPATWSEGGIDPKTIYTEFGSKQLCT